MKIPTLNITHYTLPIAVNQGNFAYKNICVLKTCVNKFVGVPQKHFNTKNCQLRIYCAVLLIK